MSPKILLAALAITAFTSCSTAYKSGQTPDDVYYSPVRTVRYEENREREQVRNDQEDLEDREIRMRIRNQRWRYFDDYSYNNVRNYNHYCNCYCNNTGWGYYNHPYTNPAPFYAPPIRFNNPAPPRVVSLGGYSSTAPGKVYTDPKTGVVRTPVRYNNSNTRGSGLGNVIREIFSPSSNNNNSNNGTRSNSGSENNTRTYAPSSSGSSNSGSSGGSSGGGVTRPGRGG
jgi:uncharacterized membrane protein YgcG